MSNKYYFTWLVSTSLLLLSLSAVVLAEVPHIIVVGLFKNTVVIKVNGQQQLLTVGQRSQEGVLLVSANSKQATLEYQGQTRVFPLGQDIGQGFAAKEFSQAIISMTPHGQYLTAGSINSLPVTFLVDTGATSVAMSMGVAKRLGLDFRLTGVRSSTHTAGGAVASWQIVLDKVKVGDILLRNIRATVLEQGGMEEVLLGMTFLSRVEMRENKGVMYLKQKF